MMPRHTTTLLAEVTTFWQKATTFERSHRDYSQSESHGLLYSLTTAAQLPQLHSCHSISNHRNEVYHCIVLTVLTPLRCDTRYCCCCCCCCCYYCCCLRRTRLTCATLNLSVLRIETMFSVLQIY